jgi:hypothetical protein
VINSVVDVVDHLCKRLPGDFGVVVLFQIQKPRLFLKEGSHILSHFLAFQDEGMLAFFYEPRVVVAQMRPSPAIHGESLLINHVIQALGSDSMLFQSKRGTAQHEIMKKCKQQIISTNLNAWDVGDDNGRSVMLVSIQECLKHLCLVMDSKRNHIDVFIGHMNISPMLFIRFSFLSRSKLNGCSSRDGIRCWTTRIRVHFL